MTPDTVRSLAGFYKDIRVSNPGSATTGGRAHGGRQLRARRVRRPRRFTRSASVPRAEPACPLSSSSLVVTKAQ